MKIGVNAFVPKPFTEFQWAPMAGTREIEEKRRVIRRGLDRLPGVSMTSRSGREEIRQGLFSLGGTEVGLACVDTAEGTPWVTSLHRHGVDAVAMHRERKKDDVLPWDFITYTTSKEVLWDRYRRCLSA